MKVSHVTLFLKPNVKALDGRTAVDFTEGDQYQDLHYIVREGQHIVNYTVARTGKRHGVSMSVHDVAQVNTVL